MEERVNQRLRELGKKKSWLMSKFSLSPATFWRKITGKTPLTYEEMQILAQSLECPPGFLTGEEERDGGMMGRRYEGALSGSVVGLQVIIPRFQIGSPSVPPSLPSLGPFH